MIVQPMGAPTVVFSSSGADWAPRLGDRSVRRGAGVGWCVDAVRRRWRR